VSCAHGQYTPTSLADIDPIPQPIPREPFGPHAATASCATETLCELPATLGCVTHSLEARTLEAADSRPGDGAVGPLCLGGK
jgi:hypothetical protein